MSFVLECKKIKRSGFAPALLGGGLLAAMIPVLNMAVRAEMFTGIPDSPVAILLQENWQIMTMLNVLLLVTGACILYYIEYADSAMQKMNSLPLKESSLFLGKIILTVIMLTAMLAMEAAATGFCVFHWFTFSTDTILELAKNFGFFLLLLLPAILLSMMVSSACKNMWVSLGIGVICVFFATMLPSDNFVLSCFPFALPFQIFAKLTTETAQKFMAAAALEIFILYMAELLLIKKLCQVFS